MATSENQMDSLQLQDRDITLLRGLFECRENVSVLDIMILVPRRL